MQSKESYLTLSSAPILMEWIRGEYYFLVAMRLQRGTRLNVFKKCDEPRDTVPIMHLEYYNADLQRFVDKPSSDGKVPEKLLKAASSHTTRYQVTIKVNILCKMYENSIHHALPGK